MVLFLLLLVFFFSSVQGAIYDDIVKPPGEEDSDIYALPDLPYGYVDLEPHIDEKTLRVHYLGHHKSYTNKMNAALVEWKRNIPSSTLARSSIVDILRDVSSVPDKWRTAIKNNGGGYVNHIIYWATMCKDPEQPSDSLKRTIEHSFGSFETFKDKFTAQAKKLFGSGYVWLCMSKDQRELSIRTSPYQDSPLSDGYYPVLVIDVWEHAYYLKHQNKRPDYIADWWNVVCWKEVEQLVRFWRIHFPPMKNLVVN